MYHPPDQAQMEKLKTEADGGKDFAQLARDFSESETSGAGGDLGWIARGQLDQPQVDAIFAAPIGQTSEIVNVAEDGLYLYKVSEEQERTPSGRQLDDLRQNAFGDWYADKKDDVVIDRGEGSV